MATYLRLKCTECIRTIDKRVNNFNYTPDKCTITLGCDGRLQPIGKHNNPTISLKPMAGVTDWHARNLVKDFSTQKVVYPTAIPEKVFETNGAGDGTRINVATGYDGQVVLAVRARNEGFELPEFLDISFILADDKPRIFKTYKYRVTQTKSTIDGKENNDTEGKVLRYNTTGANPDIVEVFVNGRQRVEGDGPDDYKLNVPPNVITFNTPIISGLVNVTVMKPPERKIVVTRFYKTVESSSTPNGAYENVQYAFSDIQGVTGEFTVYSVNLGNSGLPINALAAPVQVQSTSGVIDFGNAFFLLAKEPYLPLDRYTSGMIPFTGLDIDKGVTLKVFMDNSSKELAISASNDAIRVVYPPLSFGVFNEEKPYRQYSAGVTDQVTFDGGIIIGPDK